MTVKANGTTDKGYIEYVYDASGNKLKKIVHETGKPDKTTVYLFGTYEDDVLQFLPSEEGRIRPVRDANNNITSFSNDYFLKDHLGNVRMVLTDEQKQDVYPAATLEGNINTPTDAIYTEKDYYSINTSNVVDKPEGMGTYQNHNDQVFNNNPNSNVNANSQKVYQLIASTSGGITGLGMALKVMSGDRIDIFGKSYYNTLNSGGQNYDVGVLDLLQGMFGAPKSIAGMKGVSANDINAIPSINSAISGFLSHPDRNAETTPKAFINYIFFDEQFKYAGGGFSRVGSNHATDLSNIIAPKNGYVYIYASNESPVAVFFDNLQVVHTRGSILEETHYYPFGLTMAGISSKAAPTSDCGCPNKKGFNGNELQSKEFSDGSGLEIYDFNARTYDQQIGRFIQIDPLLEVGQESLSSYQFGWNNPIRYNDPDGKCPICPFVIPTLIELGKAAIAAYVAYKTTEAAKPLIDNVVKSIEERNSYNKKAEGNNNPKPDPSKQLEDKKQELKGEIKSLERSEKSLEKNVKEHQQKLEDYKKDPDKYDNKGQLKDVSPEMRQKRIDGRIKALEGQIKKNQNELQKATKQLEQKKKELNTLNNGT